MPVQCSGARDRACLCGLGDPACRGRVSGFVGIGNGRFLLCSPPPAAEVEQALASELDGAQP